MESNVAHKVVKMLVQVLHYHLGDRIEASFQSLKVTR
jgi:hypothetical protein